ncbi:hypothetical protein DWF00_10635 [Bosea caraganae]|uniref:Uncharacterized protein n=1 Tax=Bosea caraganae TaxID=2763117 RepID=A0A370LBR5_9HYPH|nr:hypothetical protein [Bosea caraganae]RDJ27407.1 hypothetical protein DWF00_10635 [Bosea caraganae]RDJ29423.1 hypothetical protein DWE98_02405 [Bosea caraganae]
MAKKPAATDDKATAQPKEAKPKAKRPNYQTQQVAKEIKMASLMDIFDMLDKHGQYDAFKELVRGRKLVSVSATPKAINILKRFVKDNNLQDDDLGTKIVSRSPDFECDI